MENPSGERGVEEHIGNGNACQLEEKSRRDTDAVDGRIRDGVESKVGKECAQSLGNPQTCVGDARCGRFYPEDFSLVLEDANKVDSEG